MLPNGQRGAENEQEFLISGIHGCITFILPLEYKTEVDFSPTQNQFMLKGKCKTAQLLKDSRTAILYGKFTFPGLG